MNYQSGKGSTQGHPLTVEQDPRPGTQGSRATEKNECRAAYSAFFLRYFFLLADL